MNSMEFRRTVRRSLVLILALVLAGTIAPSANAASKKPKPKNPPAAFDYTQVTGLSGASYQTVKDTYRIPAYDGAELYIEVTRPDQDGEWPTILEASPYHGTLADREGTRILPEPRDSDGKSLGMARHCRAGDLPPDR